MAAKSKNGAANKGSNGTTGGVNRIAGSVPVRAVSLQPILQQNVDVGVRQMEFAAGYIPHQWGEKAKRDMREKGVGKRTKKREARDPEAEAEAAAYKTADGQYGIPAMAIKAALIDAAHKDLGIEKTLVRKSVFLCMDDPVLPFSNDPCRTLREDMVRVGAGSADIRYRYEFTDWRLVTRWRVDTTAITIEDFLNLVNRAGFSVGVGEMRPGKTKFEHGRFEIDPDVGPLLGEVIEK